jgi:hypothetical protein
VVEVEEAAVGGGNGPIVTNSGGGASLTSNISGSGTTDYVVYPNSGGGGGIVLGASTEATPSYSNTNTNPTVPIEEVAQVDTSNETTVVPTDNSGQVAGVFDSDTGIPNWLWWVMGIVLVLMIAYFAITRSSRDDEIGRI